MSPTSRTLGAYVLVLVGGFALMATIALVSGYREQAAPQQADFYAASVAPGGIRLHGLGHEERYDFSWGWRECGDGSFDAVSERTGDTVEVDLTFRPSPHLGACPVEGSWSVSSGSGETDVLIPLEGPPPTTVVAEGDSTGHPVIDRDAGPALPFDAGWEVDPDVGATTPASDGETTKAWYATTGHGKVAVTFATGFVGQQPDAWLRTGDVRVPTDGSRSIDVEEDIHLGGEPAVVRLDWVRGTAEVELVVPDGRVVMWIWAREMDTVEVLDVVRSIAAANP